MATEYKLPFTGSEIAEKLTKVDDIDNKMPKVAVTIEDNGKFLRVVDGEWKAVALMDVSKEGL